MKEWFNKNKIILIICIVIIIAGLIMLFTKGFNKENYYTANKKIETYIEKGYEKEDIINIAKECFPDRQIDFEEIEKLEQVAAIRLKEATEEEIENYKNKIIEKYEIEEANLQIYEVDMPTSRIRTFVEPYVFSVSLVTILSLVYILIRNIKKEKLVENILKTIIILALVLGVYFSLILICRIPFGTYTMPIALTIYISTLLIVVNKANKQ